MNQIRTGAIALAVGAACSAPCFAGGFNAIARNLAAAARGAGIARVAVIPFSGLGGISSGDGRIISENLITRMVRMRKIQVVERSLLKKLMSEDVLDQTGAVASSSVKITGKMLSADGIVTGTYDETDDGVIINARLIDVETGVILAAVQREVGKKWFGDDSGSGFGSDSGAIWVPAPRFTVAAPAFPSQDDSDMRDALADAAPAFLPGLADAPAAEAKIPEASACAGASVRVDRMEARILEIKARYWAARLRAGLSPGSLKTNPGSMISDPDLKKAFYNRLEYWYHQDRIPRLRSLEAQRLVAMDREAYSLYDRCGASTSSE
ncbi:MAG: FlgO family outer membrane protein [Elusimicrobiota bacterium]